MATIGKSPTLFFVTSPRTPFRFIPELETLNRVASGKPWDHQTQTDFFMELVREDFYIGTKNPNDPAFSARDRINRAPKAYGFVKLNPNCRNYSSRKSTDFGSSEGRSIASSNSEVPTSFCISCKSR